MVTSGRDFDCPTGAFPNDANLGLYFDCPTGAPTNSDNVVIFWLRTNVPKKWLHFNVCHICLHGFSGLGSASVCHPAMNVSRGLRWVCVPKRLQNENPQYSRTRAQECQKHGFFTKVPQYRVLGPLGRRRQELIHQHVVTSQTCRTSNNSPNKKGTPKSKVECVHQSCMDLYNQPLTKETFLGLSFPSRDVVYPWRNERIRMLPSHYSISR